MVESNLNVYLLASLLALFSGLGTAMGNWIFSTLFKSKLDNMIKKVDELKKQIKGET